MYRGFILFALIIPQSVQLVRADEPATVQDKVLQAEAAIEKALAKPVSFECEDTALEDLVTKLQKLSGVNIGLHTRALDEIGIGDDTLVTIKIQNITLRSALRLALQRIDPSLTYFVNDEILQITTREWEEEQLETRFYDVRDLAVQQTDRVKLLPKGPRAVYSGDWLLGASGPDYDSIVELLVVLNEPDSWDEVGGAGSMADAGGVLVVSQTDFVHRQIDGMLSTLRAVRDADRRKPGGEAVQMCVTAEEAAAKKRFETILAKKAAFEFNEMALNDVVEYLRNITKLNVYIDTRALDEVGIGSDTPVTISIKDVTLASALRQILQAIDPTLTFEYRDESLFISTRESAEENLTTLAYPVGDIVGEPPHDSAVFDYDALIELITRVVAPDSWDEVGGPGSTAEWATGRCLMVSQTSEIQDEVAQIIARVRALLKKMNADKLEVAAPTKPVEKDPYFVAIYQIKMPRKEGEKPVDAALDELVEELIDPESWKSAEATARMIAGKLVVRQRLSNQQRIYELLMQMGLLDSQFVGGGSSSPGGFF
jgi:hypothetical protein